MQLVGQLRLDQKANRFSAALTPLAETWQLFADTWQLFVEIRGSVFLACIGLHMVSQIA
jgi:hypothetical protein